MSLKIASWRAPGSILEGSGLDFGGLGEAKIIEKSKFSHFWGCRAQDLNFKGFLLDAS